MVREDLIEGAVTFLQDPSVGTAPLEQKLSFLRSKNLTQEEIDVSLARVGQSPTPSTPAQTQTYTSSQPRQQQQYQYNGYNGQQYPPWSQAPPEPPRRDWRDWFIMATVVGGVGYAAYWTAKRYITPLIAPPTPPQLEQDKASIDASFEKAFTLLEQLATDTSELKDAERQRKERMDAALAEVESVIDKMKEANESRELEAKRMARELEDIKEQIPLAIQREKDTTDNRLKDLAGEMKSLKTLVGNRMGSGAAPLRTAAAFSSAGVNGASSPPVQSGDSNGSSVEEPEKSAAIVPERTASTATFANRTAGKAQIPSWQLAAKKKADDAKTEGVNGVSGSATAESGTATDVEAGA